MNQTKKQESQDASVTRSAENFIKHMKTDGVFHYISGDDSAEQTVKFEHIMEESDSRKEFIAAMFELYSGFSNENSSYKEGGKNILKLIDAIDDIVREHAAFAAQDEHGLIL